MRRIVMRWALLSFLLGGCQNPDLPRVASAHWPAPSAVRWTLDQPVPSELNALSIEFPPDLRADGAFDAVRRVRREGISTHEWVVFHEGRELAVPVSVPEMCPPRPSYAPVCASGRLNLSANDAALEFVLATPKRCTAQLFSSDPLSPQMFHLSALQRFDRIYEALNRNVRFSEKPYMVAQTYALEFKATKCARAELLEQNRLLG
ncbi:MAG: hypothetical protein AAFQ82_28300 [Myxococcota bacterium]